LKQDTTEMVYAIAQTILTKQTNKQN